MRTRFKLLAVGAAAALAASAASISPAFADSTDPITMVGIADEFTVPGTVGDTWDTAWSADGSLYTQNNDGLGWDGSTTYRDTVSTMSGTPDSPGGISGTDLNYGTAGTELQNAYYTTALYEVDGVLYQITDDSDQSVNDFSFRYPRLIASTDGGATWTGAFGTSGVEHATSMSDATFRDLRWGSVNFVKYGQGGDAPDVDNAQDYVYAFTNDGSGSRGAPDAHTFGDDYYLARILRSDLPNLDRDDWEFYTGGDGMNSANWDSDIANGVSFLSSPGRAGISSMVYNPDLERYLLISQRGNSYNGPRQYWSTVWEAEHPWGPWSLVEDENFQNRMGNALGMYYFVPKFTSHSGTKMWLTMSGSNSQYALNFAPMYVTRNAVTTLQAESGSLTGTSTSTSTAGYTGSGYVTGFNASGDKVDMTSTVATTGDYILQVRYHSTSTSPTVRITAGGQTQVLQLGKSVDEWGGATWSDSTVFVHLTSGSNTFTVQQGTGDTGGVDIDSVRFALYSTTTGVLPVPHGPLTGSSVKLDNACSSMVMGISANSTSDTAFADQYSWGPYLSQRWTLDALGSGLYRIQNNNSTKYLGITANGTSGGNTADQYSWGPYASQSWEFQDAGSGAFRIVNHNSGMALQPTGDSHSLAAGIVQEPIDTLDTCQNWTVTSAP